MMSYFTLKNGERLYYEDIGDGPETLVMMHGWTSTHDVFEQPVSRLKDKARCIIYDHRGHGGSKDASHEKTTMETLAGDLNEIIQGLSLSNVTLPGSNTVECEDQPHPDNRSGRDGVMTLLEAIDARHSVRVYKTDPISEEIRSRLDAFAAECSQEGDLHISIRYDDPAGFDSKLAHYGSFRNVRNYIVLAGEKKSDFDFRCGYYGEKIVLFAQQLGLNTCWTALTFNKKKVKELIDPRDSLCMVIALGYGETQGTSHKSRSVSDVVVSRGNMPEWFRSGVDAALKAPTAVNQQKFAFGMKDGEPAVMVKGIGAYTKVDLGIAAYHFEIGSGREVRAI